MIGQILIGIFLQAGVPDDGEDNHRNRRYAVFVAVL